MIDEPLWGAWEGWFVEVNTEYKIVHLYHPESGKSTTATYLYSPRGVAGGWNSGMPDEIGAGNGHEFYGQYSKVLRRAGIK